MAITGSSLLVCVFGVFCYLLQKDLEMNREQLRELVEQSTVKPLSDLDSCPLPWQLLSITFVSGLVGGVVLSWLPSCCTREEFCDGVPSRTKRSVRHDTGSEPMASFRSHNRYWENVRLALCVAFWVCIFSLPKYNNEVHYWIFGEDHGDEEAPCGEVGIGTKEDGTYCGWLPIPYYDYWPNVVQMIVFTVFSTTGHTIQLAAQGVLGTMVACATYRAMLLMYPEAATNPDTFNEPVAWIYFIGVTFLFLLSTAPENAIKFGLSWHTSFAMAFMNPKRTVASRHGQMSTGILSICWDSETSIVLLTSVTGASLAILGTLFPVPLLNITHIDDDAIALQREIKRIWSESISYFCGKKETSKHYAIESKIDEIGPLVTRIKANLSITWWETFDIGYFGSARTLFVAYANLVETMDDILFSLKTAINCEDFKGKHQEFCIALKPCMESLKDTASDLMLLCAKASMDGHVSPEEERELREKRQHVVQAQKELFDSYNALSNNESKDFPYVSKDLANEIVFIFALSAWARYVSDFADTVDEIHRNLSHESGMKHFCKATTMGLVKSICGLYAPSAMTKDHMIFVTRNLISITVCFWIGKLSEISVFTAYSATMASTCSILISKFPGSAFQKNLQRLLGLALGKVLPLLAIAFLGIFAKYGAGVVEFAHGGVILLYMFVFIYMSMTSSQWSGVGGIIAGFGCYGLLETPLAGGDDKMYSSLYREIGQVTFAIIVQFVVDTSFMMPSPRALALQHIATMKKKYAEAFSSFFHGDLVTMQSEALDMRASWDAAKAMSPECDPKLVVVPGMATDFRFNLYVQVLDLMKAIRSDFKILVIAMKNWSPLPAPTDGDDIECVKEDILEKKEISSLLGILKKLEAVGPVKTKFMGHLTTTLRVWEQVMAHESEIEIDTMELRTLVSQYDPGESVLNVDALAREINLSAAIKAEVMKASNQASNVAELTNDRRVRLTVALRALQRAVEHLSLIDSLILKEHIF